MKINNSKYKLNYQHLNVKNEETLCSDETENLKQQFHFIYRKDCFSTFDALSRKFSSSEEKCIYHLYKAR